MKRSRRIGRIHELARQREEALLRSVGRTRTRLAEEEERLETLRRYRQEYETRFRDLGRGGLRAGIASDYLRFVARLDAVIREQETRVGVAREEHEQALLHWRVGRRRTESLDRLARRVRRDEDRRSLRRAQTELDEAASRRHLNRPRGSG